jgi:ClpP class serine protease
MPVMSVGDVFWIFFMVTALQPVIRQRMLEAMRTRQIAQIENERVSRVIMLVHRQETIQLLGFPLVRYIDINDLEAVLRAIQLTDDDVPLDIILHTPGDLVLVALQIVPAIREHKAKVKVFVPHYAMAGGTLIALAANEIVLTKHSVLGPIDPQIGQAPAASLIKVVDDKPIGRIEDGTRVIADVGRKAIKQLSRPPRISWRGKSLRKRRWNLPRSCRPAHRRAIIQFSSPPSVNSAFPSTPICPRESWN